jgi:hypothetical protein
MIEVINGDEFLLRQHSAKMEEVPVTIGQDLSDLVLGNGPATLVDFADESDDGIHISSLENFNDIWLQNCRRGVRATELDRHIFDQFSSRAYVRWK